MQCWLNLNSISVLECRMQEGSSRWNYLWFLSGSYCHINDYFEVYFFRDHYYCFSSSSSSFFVCCLFAYHLYSTLRGDDATLNAELYAKINHFISILRSHSFYIHKMENISLNGNKINLNHIICICISVWRWQQQNEPIGNLIPS